MSTYLSRCAHRSCARNLGGKLAVGPASLFYDVSMNAAYSRLFLAGLLDVVDTFPGIQEVLKCFRASWCDKPQPSLVVDVICNHGNTWVKVVARKAQAMHLVWAGKASLTYLREVFRVLTITTWQLSSSFPSCFMQS